jgi:magnesium-transporting ATPase (P-type)
MTTAPLASIIDCGLTEADVLTQQLCAYNHPENSQHYDLALHSQVPLPEAVHELVEFCILASQRDPFDPMERAFKELGEYSLANTEHLHDDWQLLRAYPLSPDLLAMSHVWQSADGKQYEIATKGAPEAIADLCHFTPQQQQILATQVSERTLRSRASDCGGGGTRMLHRWNSSGDDYRRLSRNGSQHCPSGGVDANRRDDRWSGIRSDE